MNLKRLICLFKGHDWVLAPIGKSSLAYPTPDLVGKRLSHICLRCWLRKTKIAGLSRKQMEWLKRSRLRDSMEGIRASDFFLALGTGNYASSIRDPDQDDHHLITSQIAYAKSLEKPVAILQEIGLSAEDERTIREALEGMELIGVFKFESGNEESMKSAVMHMRRAIDSLVDESGR